MIAMRRRRIPLQLLAAAALLPLLGFGVPSAVHGAPPESYLRDDDVGSGETCAKGSRKISITADWCPWEEDDEREDPKSRFYPRRYRGEIRFRYEDDGYAQVYIRGSFNDWQPAPLWFDDDRCLWSIRFDLGEGKHQYKFEIEKDDESWSAIDPSNPRAEKHEDHDWVSVIRVEDDGRVHRHRREGAWRVRDELKREREHKGFGFIYQRADGVFLHITPVYHSKHSYEPSIQGTIGYGFRSRDWSGGATIVQPFHPRDRVLLKLSGYAQTSHTDQTGIGTDENTLAALFLKADYRDYYRREGGFGSLIGYGWSWLRLEGGYRVDDYFSMKANAKWTLPRGDLAENPPVDEGTMRSVFGRLTLGDELHHVDMAYERCGETIVGGSFEFEQLTAQFRTRLRMAPRRYLDLRVKGGSNFRGELPQQKHYIVGGLGTVRGYDYQSLLVLDPDVERGEEDHKPLGGERILLANLEYVFGIGRKVDMVVLFDAGTAWETRTQDVSIRDMKSSTGLGIQFGDGKLRFNVAQKLEGGGFDPVLEVRINRMF
jgi:hypothetical protein